MYVYEKHCRSDWRCGYCETVVSFGAIDDVMNTLEKQIGDVSESGHIAELEELLFHYSDLLHPNHYILASSTYIPCTCGHIPLFGSSGL